MSNEDSMSSISQLFKAISERSIKMLSKDLNRSTREARRRRELAKRGVVVANPKASVQSNAPRTIEGTLGRGQKTSFSIGGREFRFDRKTVIVGELVLGAHVTAVVSRSEDGIDYAQKIMAIPQVMETAE